METLAAALSSRLPQEVTAQQVEQMVLTSKVAHTNLLQEEPKGTGRVKPAPGGTRAERCLRLELEASLALGNRDAAARLMSASQRKIGELVFFNPQRNFGFIRPLGETDRNKNIMAHRKAFSHSSVPLRLPPGARVAYSLRPHNGRMVACKVRPLDDDKPAKIVFVVALHRAGRQFAGIADLVVVDGVTKLVWQPATTDEFTKAFPETINSQTVPVDIISCIHSYVPQGALQKFKDGRVFSGEMDWEERISFGWITNGQLECSLYAFDMTNLKCVTLLTDVRPCHCEVNHGDSQPRGFSSLSLEELVVRGGSSYQDDRGTPDFFGHNEGQYDEGQHFHQLNSLDEFYDRAYAYIEEERLDWEIPTIKSCAFAPELKICPVARSEPGVYRLASATFNLELSEGLDVTAFFADIIKQTHGPPLEEQNLFIAQRGCRTDYRVHLRDQERSGLCFDVDD